jgi:hypothetical protein
MVDMGRTKALAKRNVAPAPGRQAPVGAWSPSQLLSALKSGTREDKRAIAKAAGIIDAKGKITEKYRNWGNKVTRTPSG